MFVVRPQGLVGSPKASVIESEAKDLQKANVSLVCRGSPRKAWLQHGCKSPDDAKKITACAVIFLVRPQGLVVSPKAYVIVSHARLLAKGEHQPGVPGFATHSVVAT